MRLRPLAIALLLATTAVTHGARAAEPLIPVPLQAQPSSTFDVEKATDAWIQQMPPAARAKSDAYFEGGYWLILWDFLAGAVIALALLRFGWSAWMRDRAERISRFKPVQTILYWVQYLIATTVLGAPLAIYEGYFREHQYGLATQTFGPWMFDQLKMFLISLVFGAVFVTLLMGLMRRLQRTWWIWGSLVTIGMLTFAIFIVPTVLTPIFNKVTPLDDPKVTAPILSMARSNGIATNDVYTPWTPPSRPRA